MIFDENFTISVGIILPTQYVTEYFRRNIEKKTGQIFNKVKTVPSNTTRMQIDYPQK